ncbi:MAG: pyruvate dehydrogenase (acetyl-transferring) E1 component subunit alpha [Anaerolineaceae bacterium]|nr:MAG: pyruvate dehydrogenase (acetyl-transferring) E1 component subunit alpha [Anaerolineaceae bacterium]
MAKKPTKEQMLEFYRQMVLIREFETVCDDLYSQKRITGVYMHLYSGHEASGVGALGAIEPSDHVMTAYRDHGIALARDIDANLLMAEMMGRVDGVGGGKGGSMHLASIDHNFWGGYAIVGGHLPLSAGIAFAQQYNETGAVTLSFIGDGATNNGYFHESLNMSAVWKLPIVWIIENNFVGMGTRIEDSSGQPELHKRAIAYGMKDGGRVDGQNVVEVYQSVKSAVDYAREGNGPVLIEVLTYRYKGHGVSDRSYDQRFADELKEYQENRDPITLARRYITENYKNVESQLDTFDEEAQKTVAEAVEFAENSPEPGYDELIRNVYVE